MVGGAETYAATPAAGLADLGHDVIIATDDAGDRAPYGEAGTEPDTELWFSSTLCLNTAHATGKAGDVFLCHPFMVHTATWPHRGNGPRMIAQPAVNAPDGFALDGSDPSPVAQAIVNGLAMATETGARADGPLT